MGTYENIEKFLENIEKNKRQSKDNDKMIKVCVRIPKNILMRLKMNKLIAENENKNISLQDQVIAALNSYLNINK